MQILFTFFFIVWKSDGCYHPFVAINLRTRITIIVASTTDMFITVRKHLMALAYSYTIFYSS